MKIARGDFMRILKTRCHKALCSQVHFSLAVSYERSASDRATLAPEMFGPSLGPAMNKLSAFVGNFLHFGLAIPGERVRKTPKVFCFNPQASGSEHAKKRKYLAPDCHKDSP